MEISKIAEKEKGWKKMPKDMLTNVMRQEEPQIPKGAFEARQNEPADFFVAVKVGDKSPETISRAFVKKMYKN